MLLCKGADSIIEKRLKKPCADLEKTQEFLDSFAETGLRTLLIAGKELSQQQYNQFKAKYLKA